MAALAAILGIAGDTFRIGTRGPLLKRLGAGILQVRNRADEAFARLQVAVPTAAQDAATKGYVDTGDAVTTEHLDGGASKHDATEIDFERADGSKKVIQASSDTVEAALIDLDVYLGNRLDEFVKAVIAVADVAGSNDTTLTLQLKRADGVTNIASPRQVKIIASPQQWVPNPPLEASASFLTATVGTIVATGGGWALVETDATGAFACTARNTDDETLWFHVASDGDAQALAKAAIVLGCVPDSAAWSA